MSTLGEDVMDFGDEEDGGFLTGKLAALGIDEDLELSGGEEENEDPTGVSEGESRPNDDILPSVNGCSGQTAITGSSSMEPMSMSSGVIEEQVAEGADQTENAAATMDPPERDEDVFNRPRLLADVTLRSKPITRDAHRPKSGRANEVGAGDGGLLNMLEKPLQASRDTQKGPPRGDDMHSRSKSWKGSRGRSKGRSRGRNVTIKECAKWACRCLNEPKLYLMCRVVATIGYKKTKTLLEEVVVIQEAGGMPTADGSRKRTSGGVFFTLLKEHMEPAKLKELYADEVRVKKERERERRAATKRKMEALDAGQISMTPRDSPRRVCPSRVGLYSRGTTSKRSRGAEASTVTSVYDRRLSTEPAPP